MRIRRKLVGLISVLALAGTAVADNHERTYVDAAYYKCGGGVDRADELIEQIVKPLYDAAVKAGEIDGWGWLSHHTGGEWSRILYHSGGSVTDVISAQDKLIDQVMEDNADAVRGVRNDLHGP